MFSSWDLVRPTLWHPMSMLELSMMDMNAMPQLSMSMQQQKEKNETPAEAENKRAFSSYSFSSSSVVDEEGRKVMSTRRRYEDSTGRLKAEHEREVMGKRLKTVWNRKYGNDEGEHHTICSQSTPEEFEKLWSTTPFGKAQEKKKKELKESSEAAQDEQQKQLKQQQDQHQKQETTKSA
ncbi:unnamed protein product [Peronospora belbahrii]|uniref:Uncharacterized protein n=1 Tax=Peronospora belbahrii TaxID=622444 RepID=A0AAU9KYB0_9STRA|nr:unnamed protein product [Peronospora belbahrii]